MEVDEIFLFLCSFFSSFQTLVGILTLLNYSLEHELANCNDGEGHLNYARFGVYDFSERVSTFNVKLVLYQ